MVRRIADDNEAQNSFDEYAEEAFREWEGVDWEEDVKPLLGNDIAFLGAGNDVFQWNPGDGNDTVEGQDGTDRLLFFGANVSENVSIAMPGWCSPRCTRRATR